MFATMKIHYSDKSELEVHGRTADVIDFERRFKQPATTVIGDGGMYTEHLWFFGWLAESREREVAAFDEWRENVTGVEVVFAEDPADDEDPPTQPVDSSPAQ